MPSIVRIHASSLTHWCTMCSSGDRARGSGRKRMLFVGNLRPDRQDLQPLGVVGVREEKSNVPMREAIRA